mgnify:CR=1 FL=1
MVYCDKCGKQVPDDAYFCPNCGVRTKKGVEAGVSTPWDEMREAFSKMGKELEKAFDLAAKEIQEAFKIARENIRKSTYAETVVCTGCGVTNPSNSSYCYKCGKELKT